MKQEKLYDLHTSFGDYKVFLKRTTYFDGHLAILMFDGTTGEEFAVLTTNLNSFMLDGLTRGAFVDTNNCKWAENFIEENELGFFSGDYQQSGFCSYPLYFFDLDKIEELKENEENEKEE